MRDDTETMFALAAGNPALIPPALVEVIDAITGLKPAHDPGDPADVIDQADVIGRILRELTTDHMEVITRIASLVTLHQAATGHQTFSAWLGTEGARRTSSGREIATLMDEDQEWPRDRRTYAEFRDYVCRNHPFAVRMLDRAWCHYQDLVIEPYGEADTIRTERQYATRIAWSGGYDEIHPKTVDGVTRFEAERWATEYNDDLLMSRRNPGEAAEPGEVATAAVVKRTVVYGPWYAV